RRRGETVGEAGYDTLPGLMAEIDVDASPVVERQHAEGVDAMRMVRVLMRVEHRFNAIDLGREQLLAQVAAGVDDDAGGRAVARAALDQQRTAAAAVLRIGRIAHAPIAADARHAAR